MSDKVVAEHNHIDNLHPLLLSLSSTNQARKVILRRNTILIKYGQRFDGVAVDFRDCLQKLSIQTGFQFICTKNHANRITIVCAMKDKTNCVWMGRAKKTSNGFFYVIKLCRVNTCGTSSQSSHVSRISFQLAKYIVQIIRDKPTTTPLDVTDLVFSQYGIKVSYKIAWFAFNEARKMIYGGVPKFLNSLPAYANSVFRTNPGSDVILEVDPESRRFKRMFIAFDACFRGFSFCRPLLYLDEASLICNFEGHLFATAGRDGNNGLYPLCYAVVDSEDYENWHWFLLQLRRVLRPPRKMTFLSDGNIQLMDALVEVLPDADHSYCVNHLELNMKYTFSSLRSGNYLKDHMVDLLIKCAYASTVEEFHKYMDEMLRDGGELTASFFELFKPEKWANAYFKGCHYGNSTSSASESSESTVLLPKLK